MGRSGFSVMLSLLLVALISLPSVSGTALDDYVWKEDDNYKWVDMGPDYQFSSKVGNRSYIAHTLNMTSQRWLTDSEFSPSSDGGSIWWHYLVVIVPDGQVFKNNASLWITGGSVTSSAPSKTDEDILVCAALATETNSVVGALFTVPNEHLTFTSDPLQQSRTEDAIIAFTWATYLNDPTKPEWLLRFPMVKASVRALDAVTDFMKVTYPDDGYSLDYYTVAGASKRGWTTWLVGAVDPKRVVAIVPIVLDAINFVEVEHHQFRSYGGWTWALHDYTEQNLTMRFDDPNMIYLQQEVDPYFYKDRLHLPKFVVNAGMDEFQQPDDTHYWWKDMPEPKHFLLAPDAEHSLATGILEVVPAIAAWIGALLEKKPVPKLTWEISEETGEIVATVDHSVDRVHKASVFYAYSCGVNAWDNNKFRRDFRVVHLDSPCTCGPEADGYCTNLAARWYEKNLEHTIENGKRTYRAKLDAPDDGRWVSFFIDIKFADHSKETKNLNINELKKQLVTKDDKLDKAAQAKEVYRKHLKKDDNDDDEHFIFPHDLLGYFEFTTEVSILPNTFPYPDCYGESCGKRLV